MTRPALLLTLLLVHAQAHAWPLSVPRDPLLPVLSGWAQSFESRVYHWADANLVPRWLAMRVLRVESDANPFATGNEWVKRRSHGKTRWVRGKALAEGAFMIATNAEDRADHLKRAGMTLAEFDPWDADDSARVGLSFLGYLLRYFDRDPRPSVAGYNSGRGAARRWWDGRSGLPLETQRYLVKVLG